MDIVLQWANPNSVSWLGALGLMNFDGSYWLNILTNIFIAVAILFLGWLVAVWVSSVVKGILKQTNLDNRLADWVAGSPQPGLNIEAVAGGITFWIIMILAVVAVLNFFNLTTVSQPLNNFLSIIFEYLPKLGGAALLLALAWVIATVVKGLTIQAARSFELDSRFNSASNETPIVLSETLGNALYWFVFLFFLPILLDVLGLKGTLGPVQNLLNDVLAALPRILEASIIAGVGWFVAQIVRGIVSNLVAATGIDQMGSRVGLSRSTTGQSLSSLLGLLVYVLILIPTATAALAALKISAIADPATNMLNQVLKVIPQIFMAGLILAVAYGIGRFIADLVTSLLQGFGFDNILTVLGIQAEPRPSAPIYPESEGEVSRTVQTPSEIAGIVVLVGIMLFATIAAVDVLQLPALKTVVLSVLAVAGQVLVGVLIFAVGMYFANLSARLIRSSGVPQSGTLANTARIVILAFTGAMALERAGVSTNIVNLAFGLLLGAVAVAIAIAFGLGGREVAAEQLRDWVKPFKK
ncbi:mechanosensitive ion channel [Alkalinema sp. FACHB-956]|uniref:mechanosensitive ion channel n=1 Tax=Alkalinema sp. FACHB-956 TaxID=2692768 RepID=UPI0016880501|nr:mechanosensitive ion channel [Alkalinema sp. FACHB-956]MBD2327027.1 mechanosensitive ion channel [Alkalinema sp. FACHB-956]